MKRQSSNSWEIKAARFHGTKYQRGQSSAEKRPETSTGNHILPPYHTLLNISRELISGCGKKLSKPKKNFEND